MKILLTGASGSLGKVFLENLDFKFYEVVTIGRTPPMGNFPLRHIFFDFQKKFKLELDYKPDCILHLAGLPSTEGNQYSDYFLINTKSTETLVEFANQKNVKKFIYSSSASVYGGGENLKETSPLNGNSFYALSKIEAEKILLKSFQGSTLIFRIASVYGRDSKSFINQLINFGKKGFFPYPLENIKRSFVHILDVITVLQKSLVLDVSGIYNLAYPEVWSYEDLVKLIDEILVKNKISKPIKIPIPKLIYTLEEKLQNLLKKPSKLKPLFETSTLNVENLIHTFGNLNYQLHGTIEELILNTQ